MARIVTRLTRMARMAHTVTRMARSKLAYLAEPRLRPPQGCKQFLERFTCIIYT